MYFIEICSHQPLHKHFSWDKKCSYFWHSPDAYQHTRQPPAPELWGILASLWRIPLSRPNLHFAYWCC